MTRLAAFLLLAACSAQASPPSTDKCADGNRPEWMGTEKDCRFLEALVETAGDELDGGAK